VSTRATESRPAYLDTSLPVDQRVRDLVRRMTLEEKVSQMVHGAAAIERLGVPEYNWWNECLHGVARAGIATVFPQAIGMAATWNPDLIRAMAMATSDEARAKHHAFVRQGDRGIYKGLTFWSPNVNIFRDPRWGRGQETYGEDPYLTARLGVAFVQGLQGDDPTYLKVVATPKHLAAHSGPEAERHSFNATVSQRDRLETYLPAFQACVQEGGAASIMGAYNRINGEPCCASPTLLGAFLRHAWGFDGYVVSDCGAIDDIYQHHGVVATAEEAAALAVRSGCDLNCGTTYPALVRAVRQGLLDEAVIDRAVERLFTARFRLGMFDPPEQVPYTHIPSEVIDSPQHRQLALQVARESIVLLKNANGILPLSRDASPIAVIGPNAHDVEVLLGNYHGTPSTAVTPLDGIRAKLGAGAQVRYAQGCAILGPAGGGIVEAVEAARGARVAIVCVGLSQQVEGEEGEADLSDRIGLGLPGMQQQLLEAVDATGVPLVVVLLNGSPVDLRWAEEHAAAIIESWYPGEEGGTALADVLFGDYDPAGRLPITFYRSLDQVPPFEDYAMEGRTYRFLRDEPLYPFGYGLSYTRFRYTDLTITPAVVRPGESVRVSARVENVGERAGDEVVQLYLSDLETSVPVPLRHLEGFARIHLAPGESRVVSFTLQPRQMALVDDAGRWAIEPGAFGVYVGGGQPVERTGGAGVACQFHIVGETTPISNTYGV
jgi:beta-glucosidase